MPARLVALNGPVDIHLSGLLTIAGRHSGCDARLDSSRVSRRHCCLAVRCGEVLVRDLGSTNGTWVNDRRIKDSALRPGDVLGIAHLRFRLVMLGPAESGGPCEPEPTAPEHVSDKEAALLDEVPPAVDAPSSRRSDGR
jgi:pSer/pThr/pTyr-binding forkhead associated (FHA) protein